MKTLIIIFSIGLISLLLYSCLKGSDETNSFMGTVDDIQTTIEKLMKSQKDDAFLIITIQGTEDFIQLTGDINGVQLDFPLITSRQNELETYFWKAAEDLDLKVVENKGSDGSRFLDIDINGNASNVSDLVKTFISNFLSVNRGTKLEFEVNI